MGNIDLIKPYFLKSAPLLILGFLALSLCDLGQMVIPRIVGYIFDLLASFENRSAELWRLLAVILGLAVFVALLRYLWRHLIYGFSRGLEKDLRRRLEDGFLGRSLSWHQRQSTGDMMALATNDIESVRIAVGFGLVSLVDAMVLGITAVSFMVSIDLTLSLWAFLPMPLITVLTALFGKSIYRRMLETQDIFGRLTEIVREQLSGFKVIRAMALESLAQAEVSKVGTIYLKKNVQMAIVIGCFFPLMAMFTNLAVALALYIGGKATILGSISPGDFVAFITYLTLLSWPMLALGMTFGLIQEGLASLNRLSRVLKAQEPQHHPKTADFPDPQDGFEIRFEKVSFQYPARDEPVFADLDLTLAEGAITAVAGPTGCGKSTLAALIPALLEPTKGTILVNGVPTTKWPLDRLRGLFGYVPQDGHIFTGTMRQNLSFGRFGATDEEIEKAAQISALPIDLNVFPQGLDTLIGERGLTLSGGQRQRLALARAILLDPPFLILDDTLSAVDAEVEEIILSRLVPLRRGRGTLIISHRVTSLSKAANVAVLENGRISETGLFEELIKSDGYLSRIAALARLGAEGYGLRRGWARIN
jgi:ATP-binding cassette subfamily B protein